MKKLALTPTQSKLVSSLVHASTSAQSVVLRGGLILDYAVSENKASVASKHGVGRDTVRRWCQRWHSHQDELERLEAEYQAGTLSESRYRRQIEKMLADADRPGAPVTFTEAQKQQILAMATRKPEDEGVPVTHWSHDLLARTVVNKGIVKGISPAQIGRLLKGSHPAASSEQVLGTSQY